MKFMKKHHLMREALMQDLTKIKFEVKIVDYGLARILEHGEYAGTPAGTPELIAPEIEDNYYDQRVDVWGIGLTFYMMLTMAKMFKDRNQVKWGRWCISSDLDFTVEGLRFINETVMYDPNRRAFPDQLKDHPYFQCDVSQKKTIRELLPDLLASGLECMNTPGEARRNTYTSAVSTDAPKLWFNAKDPSDFEQLYKHITGQRSY